MALSYGVLHSCAIVSNGVFLYVSWCTSLLCIVAPCARCVVCEKWHIVALRMVGGVLWCDLCIGGNWQDLCLVCDCAQCICAWCLCSVHLCLVSVLTSQCVCAWCAANDYLSIAQFETVIGLHPTIYIVTWCWPWWGHILTWEGLIAFWEYSEE